MGGHRHAPGITAGLVYALMSILLAGCPRYGIVDDGSSISYGPSHEGKLMNPARLPARGDGYVMPHRWAVRGLHYGTDELVSLIVYAGRRIAAGASDAVLGVADLSPRRGGPSSWHRSHQTGRDVDLLFFVRDADGKPVQLDMMIPFAADGRAVLEPQGETGASNVLVFDVERNWMLVRALIENPIAQVQYLFIYEPLEQLLLDHARASGEPADLIELASYLLHQPSDSLPHDDHLHVRIYCSPEDRDAGCVDRGALRWTKKSYKYGPLALARGGASTLVRTALLAPMPAMMVLGALPFVP